MQTVEEASDTAEVIPVFSSGDVWAMYDGNAALDGVFNSEGTLAVVEALASPTNEEES